MEQKKKKKKEMIEMEFVNKWRNRLWLLSRHQRARATRKKKMTTAIKHSDSIS
jgi:hypothetical protein